MNKVLFPRIFTLFIILSFFFSVHVKADTYNYEISSSDFEFLFDEDFNLLKDYMDSLNTKYYIFRKNGVYSSFSYNSGFITNVTSSQLSINRGAGSYTFHYFEVSNGSVTERNNFYYSDTIRNFIVSSSIYYNNYLYSNFDLVLSDSPLVNTYNISYDNYSFTIGLNSDLIIPSLYDIYNEVNTNESDNFPKLTQFYTIVFEKITLFANNLLDNYIYLSIFGIFILIFLIELIRRYLL